MDAPVWTSGDVGLELATERDWPTIRVANYDYIYDGEPPEPTAEASMWWRQLWGMVVVARRRERFIGYLRTGYSSPGDLLTRLQAGAISLTEADALATAIGLYLRLLMWQMPINRIYVEIPRTPQGEAFAEILAEAGFAREGRYPEHVRAEGAVRDVLVLGFLRQDLDAG